MRDSEYKAPAMPAGFHQVSPQGHYYNESGVPWRGVYAKNEGDEIFFIDDTSTPHKPADMKVAYSRCMAAGKIEQLERQRANTRILMSDWKRGLDAARADRAAYEARRDSTDCLDQYARQFNKND